MAKIRVYELARELSLSNKALIDKLEKMNISVKSHMSVIEDKDELLQKIRGAETESPVLDEIRVKSTVIRRRKKSIKTSSTPEVKPEKPSVPVVNDELPPESSEIPESPESPESPEPPESIESLESTESPEAFQSSESSESEDIEKEKIDLPPQESEEITDEEVKKEEKDIRDKPPVIPAKQNKRRKKGKDVSAKIIKLPDPVIKKSEPPTSDAEPLQESDQSVPPYRKKAASAAASKIDADEIEGVSDSSKKDEKKKDKFVKADEDKKAAALQKKKGFKKEETFKWKEVIERGDIHTDVIPSRKKKKGKRQKGQKTQLTTPKASKRRIKIDETIILSELGKRMGVKSNEIIAKLMSMGVMVTVNQTIDFETASLVASEFGFETYKAAFEESDILENIQDDPEKMIKRPPIVTIMGHVDHGKTSLLDVIRKTKVIDTETGGITQHIGAYSVKTDRGEITFLDTPGHEAFTSMRARGAMVTDIVVLVVAADDGVMPQTIEAINHSKVANVPIIVAINKIDKPGTNYERIERELSEQGLISEKWGGDTIFVNVSAKKNIGIDELLEMILIQADMLELKANPDKQAYGYVIEAKLDLGKGPVATVLVQEGTLKTGDIIVCGIHYGKVRALIDDLGNSVDSAEPSIPVEVLGLSGVPVSGDKLISTSDEKKAKQISSYRTQKQRFVELAKTNRMNLEALFEKMQKGEVKSLNLIIKADVQGSIEALKESLTQLSIDEVEINIIHFATGTITETDISLAAVSNAIIIGFNVRPSGNIAHMADEEHVDIRYYDIIYDVINDIKNAVVGLMKSTFKENVLGRAGVRKVFHVPKIGTVAGCHVMDGKIERNKKVRILREGVILYDGNISSLKRYKDDVKEVLSGYECGISIEKYNDIKESDIIESYFIEEIKPDINL